MHTVVSRIVFPFMFCLGTAQWSVFVVAELFEKVMLVQGKRLDQQASAALFSLPYGAPEGPNNSHLQNLSECEVFN